MDSRIRLFIVAVIGFGLLISIIATTTVTKLSANPQKPESQRYQMVQGRDDRSQIFILDTYTGSFWFVDYWGIPEEKPRIKGPYHILDQ